MRTYTANLSRRLGPVFSEMAARAASLGPYRDAKAEVCVNLPTSASYKPAHGGYPTVKAQA